MTTRSARATNYQSRPPLRLAATSTPTSSHSNQFPATTETPAQRLKRVKLVLFRYGDVTDVHLKSCYGPGCGGNLDGTTIDSAAFTQWSKTQKDTTKQNAQNSMINLDNGWFKETVRGEVGFDDTLSLI